MGELARRRRERDQKLSRSQLVAVAVGGVLLASIVVLLGYGLARRSAPEHVVTAEPEELVDLLARVDAAVVSQDGVDTLTFPDTLTGVAEAPALPSVLATSTDLSSVAAGDEGSRPFDLLLRVETDNANLLAEALRARGWSVNVELGEDAATLRIDGRADLAKTRIDAQHLREDLASLEQESEVVLSPK